MVVGRQDWANVILIQGQDTAGNAIVVAVDSVGQIVAVFKGEYEGNLITVKVDEEGYIPVHIQGRYGDAWKNLLCDEDGRLTVSELAQTNISKDLTENATWDDPLTSLLSNLNRIRYAIAALTAEDWGTFTSIASRIATHAALTTGVHGAGTNTILYSNHNVAAAHGRTNLDGVTERDTAITTHAALSASVHGVSSSGFEDKANKDVNSGYAALSSAGDLLAKGSNLYLARNVYNTASIVERTSGETAFYLVRAGAEDYDGLIKEGGTTKQIITEGLLAALPFTILPSANNTYNLGSSTKKWANMWTVVDHVGDLVWLEQTCAKCHLPFSPFDEIVMVAVSLDEGTRTVPEHIECTRAFKELEARITRLEAVVL